MLSQSQPREILRAAIVARNDCQLRIDAATSALARADDLVRKIEAHLTEYADVDEAIASHSINEVKAWANSGGQQPKLDVPPNLMARRKERDAVQERVIAAKAARATLSEEVEVAKSARAEADISVGEAAKAVMFDEATTIAARLQAVKREEWSLADQLRGLAALWLPSTNGHSVKPVQLPQQISDALAKQEPKYPHSVRPELGHTETWRAFYSALVANPEATIDGAL